MKKLKDIFNSLPAFLKNKYILAPLIMVIWMAFFDSHNWIKQGRLKSDINDLQEKKEFYQSEIKKDSIALHDLTNNPLTQEKIAREKYLMKKENEDIIIIIDADE
jgi:hypothetical protein